MNKIKTFILSSWLVFSVTGSLWAAYVPGTIPLAWDASPSTDVTGYKIYYGTVAGTYTNSVDVGSVLTYVMMGLTPGTKYYFAATAYNVDKIESPYSNVVSTSIPLPPIQLRINSKAITLTSFPGATMLLQTSADLKNWSTTSVVQNGTSDTSTIQLAQNKSMKFFKASYLVPEKAVRRTSAPPIQMPPLPPGFGVPKQPTLSTPHKTKMLRHIDERKGAQRLMEIR